MGPTLASQLSNHVDASIQARGRHHILQALIWVVISCYINQKFEIKQTSTTHGLPPIHARWLSIVLSAYISICLLIYYLYLYHDTCFLELLQRCGHRRKLASVHTALKRCTVPDAPDQTLCIIVKHLNLRGIMHIKTFQMYY